MKPMARGRVFTLNGVEDDDSDDLMQGTILLNHKPCRVLFDFGATHSFVSYECVNRLNLFVSDMPIKLQVSTPQMLLFIHQKFA